MAGYGEFSYGVLGYNEVLNNEAPTPETLTPDLMQYMPGYYSVTGIMNLLEQQAIAPEVGQLKYRLYDLLLQFFVDTATWGLDHWEELLGIETDSSKPYDFRRSVICAKLRGAGTTPKEMIQNTAGGLLRHEVDVIEYPGEYRFVVKFVGTRGIPPNIPELANTIEDIKPAHLAFSFAYTFLWWEEAKSYTWTGASIMTWNQFRDSAPI